MKTRHLFFSCTSARVLQGLALLLTLLLDGGDAGAWEAEINCRDDYSGASEIFIPVTDSISELPDIAHGLYAAPDSDPTHLVVIGHGAGHTIESWRRHAEVLANEHGYLVVAMEYRDTIRRVDNDAYPNRDAKSLYHDYKEDNPVLPRADGWPVRKGGEDLNAATRAFLNACPGIRTTVLTGISMGVSMTGWALAHDPVREDGAPLYDYWLAIEGVHNLTESYFEDRAANDSRTTDGFTNTRFIEEEAAGGEPDENGVRERVKYEHDQEPYHERTNLLIAPHIAENAGLSRVFYVHAVYDGLVPYWQSRAMANAMSAVPFEFYTVTLRLQGDDGTVLEDHVLDPVNDQVKDREIDFEAPLAGHAKESRDEHVVMRASFDRLADLINGIDRRCGEYVSYDMLNPDSPESPENSQVVSTPVPGQTYDCDAAPARSHPAPAGGGKAKGSGWLRASDGKKINFGFKVDSNDDSDSDSDSDNRLKLRDKEAGVKIKINDITAIGGVNGICGSIEPGPQAIEFHGDGTYNGSPASFRVCIEDNGKGKKDPRDRFVLSCLQGCSYNTSARAIDQLGGGNIKLYRAANSGETANSEAASDADVLLLDPILDDEVLPGAIKTFEVIAYNGSGERLANARVELHLEGNDGNRFSIAAATNVNGVALIPLQFTGGTANVFATSGSTSSNWIALGTRTQ